MKIMPEILENEEHMVLGDAVYFPDMEHNFYHSVPGISSSNIRRFGQSQLHAFEEENETTPAMKFGTAAHSLIVEGEEAFVNDVVCLSGSPYTNDQTCLLYTSPSPRDGLLSRMPSSA